MHTGSSKACGSQATRLATAIGALKRGELESAIERVEPVETFQEPLRNLAALIRLHALYARGDRAAMVEVIADEISRNDAGGYFVPTVSALRDLAWNDYARVSRPISAAIALHALWTRLDDSKVASLMRFSTGHALRTPLKRTPSSLYSEGNVHNLHQLVYFLRRVCVPSIIDQSRVISGTRAILEERQAICSLLRDIDPKNVDIYNEEITDLANRLAIDEGQWIVDSTRIHVDTDALSRWADRELMEDFGRYRDLANVQIDDAQSFDDVLRELIDTIPSHRSGFTPETEADAVLFSILRRLGNEFLSNPTFGLDFNLSKRVRHQSFIGLIRGPIEMNQLITTRGSENGEYNENSFWLNKFSKTGPQGREQIAQALRKFAAHFDDTLTQAKDARLHLRSQEKPSGMLVLDLSARLVSLARAIIGLDVSFEEFLSSATALLWRALDPSLESVRHFIAGSLKQSLIEGFDTLRAEVRKVAEQDSAFLEFDAAVGNGSAEVQKRLDEASSWFQHADSLGTDTVFTLEQVVRIAVDTALKSQRNYSPDVSHEVEGDILIHSSSLIFVHDVLFVALGNAQKHSGLKTPKVNVKVRWDEPDNTLVVKVVCDSKGSNRAANEKKIESIRELIASGKIAPRTRREGESGFVKLAAVVGQSKKGKIDFGYTDDSRFQLTVTYAITIVQKEINDG